MIFAMVRAWETPFGLAISGVVMPGVDQDTLYRAAASSPSVELWPAGSGRTLVGLHLVPTPAWPVAASAGGDSTVLTMEEHVRVAHPEGGYCADCEHAEGENPFPPKDDEGDDDKPKDKEPTLQDLMDSLKRIEKAIAVLAEEALTDVPQPKDDGPKE
jgi:hypothetical protein